MKKENNDNTSRNTQIEEFLSDRYEFRYNTVLNRAEYLCEERAITQP